MQEIQGNWRIRQAKKIETARCLWQSVLSFVLSINLVCVSPPVQAQQNVTIEMEVEPFLRRSAQLDLYRKNPKDLVIERRTPVRVDESLYALLANACNTRDQILIPEINEDIEEPEVVMEDEPKPRYIPTEEEYQLLCQLVEAEVTGYDVWVQKGLTHEQIINAKARVAQVFLNRVESTRFDHNTLKGCILEPSATSTLLDGRFWQVAVTDYTKEAVEVALSPYTPDMTQSALFFSSGPGEPYGGGTMFIDEVGHKFAK